MQMKNSKKSQHQSTLFLHRGESFVLTPKKLMLRLSLREGDGGDVFFFFFLRLFTANKPENPDSDGIARAFSSSYTSI